MTPEPRRPRGRPKGRAKRLMIRDQAICALAARIAPGRSHRAAAAVVARYLTKFCSRLDRGAALNASERDWAATRIIAASPRILSERAIRGVIEKQLFFLASKPERVPSMTNLIPTNRKALCARRLEIIATRARAEVAFSKEMDTARQALAAAMEECLFPLNRYHSPSMSLANADLIRRQRAFEERDRRSKSELDEIEAKLSAATKAAVDDFATELRDLREESYKKFAVDERYVHGHV